MNVSLAAVIIGALTLAVPFGGALFAIVRYVIRAETSELRNNGGSTMKDKVDKVVRLAEDAKVSAGVAAVMAERSADMAEESAKVAGQTKTALDDHVEQSKALIEQGARDKAAITARQDAQDQTIAEQKHTISNLAEALPVVARSIPPEETPHG